jgi:outer membrane protein assembly factor BamB
MDGLMSAAHRVRVMRFRTLLVAGLLVASLTGVVAVGLAGSGGALSQQWVSDTARDNEVNHHAVGVGPRDEVVVAPVAAVPNAEKIGPDSCSLVRLRPSDGAVRWRWSVPAESCFTHALTQPAVADLDGDGSLEVAVSTTEDALVVLDGARGTERWRVPLSAYGYGQPSVGDITGGPAPEVVTSDIDGTLVVVHGNGTVAWRADANTTVWTRPELVDANDDGTTEVVLGGENAVIAYTQDGTVAWNRSVDATTMALADGPESTVLAGTTRWLRGLDGATGATRWNRSVDGTPRIHETGDADGDGDQEVYAGVGGDRVLALDARTGDVEWETPVGEDSRRSARAPVLGDVTGDNATEVVAVTNAGTVAVLDGETGEELAAFQRSVRVWTFPTLADLNGDGDREVLVRYGDGRVVALDWEPGGGSPLQVVD